VELLSSPTTVSWEGIACRRGPASARQAAGARVVRVGTSLVLEAAVALQTLAGGGAAEEGASGGVGRRLDSVW
jgi:hypothetical protein